MFTFPVPGPVTSPYGPRGKGFHNGVDFGWLKADPVNSRHIYAPATGTVTVGWNALVGNFIELPTSIGLLRLAHFDSIAVKSGDQVVQGRTFLGVMGETGSQSSGVHLHVDLYMKDGRVDPLPHFTIPFGKPSTAKPRKRNMPINIAKQSTLDGNGGAVFGRSEYATLGESVNPVILYKRERDNDIAPAFSAAYGPHTPVSDKAWADLIARYTVATPAAGGFTPADRARLQAVPTADQNGAAARTAIVKP